MASGNPAPEPPPLHATRQMLDELDALMERMLALPITDPAEDVPATEPSGTPAKSRPLAATLTLLPESTSAPRHGGAHAPINPSHMPVREVLNTTQRTAALTSRDATDRKLNSFLPEQRTSPAAPPLELPELPDAPARAPQPLSNHVLPPATEPNLETLFAEVPDPPVSPVSWFIVPLLWGNHLFDRATLFLGEPGAWLRGPSGRGAVGLAGLVFLAAAVLWFLRDALGWTW